MQQIGSFCRPGYLLLPRIFWISSTIKKDVEDETKSYGKQQITNLKKKSLDEVKE